MGSRDDARPVRPLIRAAIAAMAVACLPALASGDALRLQSNPFSVPAAVLGTGGAPLHEQLPDGVTSLSSQLDACAPFLTECADDFAGDGSTIEMVSAWGKFWEPTGAEIAGLTVRILGATAGGVPDAVLAETHVTARAATGDELVRYDVLLDVPVLTTPGETYFLSVVVEHCSPPQWGWATGAGTGAPSWFRSETFGYPEWTGASEVYGVAHELAFRLTGLPVPVEALSWSGVKSRFR